MNEAVKERLILCAEIVREGATLVAHTLELDAESAFVQTDESASPGDLLRVRLSFPGLVEPFELGARVISQKASIEAGDPRGWWLRWEIGSAEEQRALRALLDAPGQVPAELAEGVTYRVLLVDDSRLTRDIFALGVDRFFSSRNTTLEVDVATSSDEAWKKLAKSDYDLVIVDYYLPGGNGDSLIARLRGEGRNRGLPVLAISCGGTEARVASLEAGADLFLEKPIMLRDLYSTLDRLAVARETS